MPGSLPNWHSHISVSYPAAAKLLMRDRLCQVVDVGHCYSNIIEDAQHSFKIHLQSGVVHNVFQAATREALSHLQMPMNIHRTTFRILLGSVLISAKQYKTQCCILHCVS